MRKTPLHDIHASQGAIFEDFSGWLMPKSYGDYIEEYLAIRNNVGIVDLSHRGKLRFSGKEHIKFLQGMLTNDVASLGAGKGLYGALLTVKGKMIADMRVYRDTESILLDLEPGLNEKIRELLIKFRLSYRAHIEDVTESLALLSVQGQYSRILVQRILGEEIPELNEYDFLKREINDSQTIIARANRTGEEGYDIFVPPDGVIKLWESLSENGKELGLKLIGLDAIETVRVEAAIPKYGADMDENTIPIEAGIWHALSFDKGCYVGQEVIARIKWRGHVNRHLVGLEIEGEGLPAKDDKIFYGDREIGYITSSVFSPILKKTIALGYIRKEFAEPGTRASVKIEDEKVVSSGVVKIPFYGS